MFVFVMVRLPPRSTRTDTICPYTTLVRSGGALMIAIGPEAFDDMLAGARSMDEHFRTAPVEENLPAMLGLLGVWYTNVFGACTHAVLPYAEDLQIGTAHV